MLSISIRISHFKANDNGHVPWRNSLCEKKKWSNTWAVRRNRFSTISFTISLKMFQMMSQNREKNHIVSNIFQKYHTQVFRSNEYRVIEPLFVNFNRIEITLIIYSMNFTIWLSQTFISKKKTTNLSFYSWDKQYSNHFYVQSQLSQQNESKCRLKFQKLGLTFADQFLWNSNLLRSFKWLFIENANHFNK